MSAKINFADLPILQTARDFAESGILTGASNRNWSSYDEEVKLREDFPVWQRHLLTDPQTSGGLLVACSPECVKEVLAEFHIKGFSDARVIGELQEGPAELHID